MIRIYIFSDSHKHFSDFIAEYKKRLGKEIELCELKPCKKGSPEQIISTETDIMRQKLEHDTSYKIVLSPQWKNISTEEFSSILQEKKNYGDKVTFVIGGANGLDYNTLRNIIDFEISFGKMTFPHSLVLWLLLEQIYRSSQIQKGTLYHK